VTRVPLLDRIGTTGRVAGFVLGLAAVFVAALGVGAVAGPDAPTAAAASGHDADPHGSMADVGSRGGHDGHDAAGGEGTATASSAAALPGGLAVARDGYALRVASATAPAGRDVPVTFTVTGPDGRAVTAYDVEHEKSLHLIAVRRDQTGFQHVHPTLATDGTWSTRLALTPGSWRLFADFKATGGEALTLGADLAVAGAFTPEPPSGEVRTARVDGYTVTLTGDLVAGRDARLALRVTRDGRPVTDLDPYLGAYGHLVALRDGDLAYLHVHPDGEPGDGRTTPGPEVVFHAAVPSAGGYHLYLDFQREGVVRTAAFVVTASEPSATATPRPSTTMTTTTTGAGGSDGHGH
jgi:hypothetical protein